MATETGVFDLCVVGAGMIGSAAARHASLAPGVRVCLVGPTEPQTKDINDGRDIYGAHYDEGRITRCADTDPIWATLARHSIARYRDIEKQSGIQFYQEAGFLAMGTAKQDFITKVKHTVATQNIQSTHLNSNELVDFLSYMKISPSDVGMYEAKNSGYISPRNLVTAEQKLAVKQGCTIVNDVVHTVKRTIDPDGNYVMQVLTENGRRLLSKKVLLATGAFTTFRELLPGFVPDQELAAITVAKLEISAEDAQRLKKMPSIIYEGKGHPDWSQDFPQFPNGNVYFYMLPPVRYPDGKYYIKLGPFHETTGRTLETMKDVKDWFCIGDPQLAQKTATFVKSMFKDVSFKSCHGDYCVIVPTSSNRPYIDKVHSQLGVAIGGNGAAAKSCDEIGRIAAMMMLKGWDSEIPKENLKLRMISPNKQVLTLKSKI